MAQLSSYPTLPPERRSIVQEAHADLRRHPMTQPWLATPQGVRVRQALWRRAVGARAGPDRRVLRLALGAAAGLLAGWVLGIALLAWAVGIGFVDSDAPSVSLVTGLLAAAGGGYAGWAFGGAGDYKGSMMLTIVNERRSRKRKVMVTAQAECWVPKVLVQHRSHDWRYEGGLPYLWLMLPYGRRVEEMLHGTMDYLELAADPYRAQDDAVYAQRNSNRMVSDNALMHSAADDDGEPESQLAEWLPWFAFAGEIVAGILLYVLSTG